LPTQPRLDVGPARGRGTRLILGNRKGNPYSVKTAARCVRSHQSRQLPRDLSWDQICGRPNKVELSVLRGTVWQGGQPIYHTYKDHEASWLTWNGVGENEGLSARISDWLMTSCEYSTRAHGLYHGAGAIGRLAVEAWFAAHPRYHRHFHAHGCFLAESGGTFFAEITDKRIRRGIFRSVGELVRAILGLHPPPQPQSPTLRGGLHPRARLLTRSGIVTKR
jgi:hypothetical protein